MSELPSGKDSQLHHVRFMAARFDLSVEALLICGFSICFLAIKVYGAHRKRVDVPVVGAGGLLGPWIAAIRYIRNARACIQEGYEKHKNYAFQVATPSRWEIFICNKEMIKEYRNLDSQILSANAATADFLQAKYTLPGAAEGIHKIPTLILTKALTWQRMRAATKADNYFSEFYDELMYALSVEIPVADEGWTPIPCFSTMARVITRITAKSLVGRPLCRDPEIVDNFLKYASTVPTSGWFIAMFPEILKPLAASVCSAPRMVKRLETILLELIYQRRIIPPNKPNDLVDWLMKWVSENAASEYNEHDIAIQIVSLVFGAVHSTTQLLAHCLFELSTRIEYIKPLRQEVNQCLNKYGGWNKEALEAMQKLDSFIRECQRYNPMDAGMVPPQKYLLHYASKIEQAASIGSLARRASQDFTFSNGLHIPAGSYIYAPNAPILGDSENYSNPGKFDGFRHYRLRQERGQSHNHTFVSASMNNLQFGDGRHVCPGRYMAADEIRTLLAHILMSYDVAIKGHGPRPANIKFAKVLLPNLKAEIILRKIRSQSHHDEPRKVSVIA